MTREERRQRAWEQMPAWQRHFAMTLYRLVEEHGGQSKTAIDMAEHGLKVNQGRLSNYIYGKHVPGLDMVHDMAAFFGVSVLEFIIEG